MVSEAAITTEGLTVRRGGRDVLHSLDLRVEYGTVTGLLGPSGCGKSTLMRAVVGIQARISGSLQVLGLPAGATALRHRVGYATQSAAVYDDLSVRENMRYFGSLLGVPHSEADRVISRVGLDQQATQRVDSLSGGQRGRVSLGAALLGSPELLVLDEPTVGLDPVLREELWQLFHELAADGTTLLVSSHVMDEALRCDRLLLMREGRILVETTPNQLLERTGTRDPETAFLRVIEGAESHEAPHATGDLGRSKGRHA